MVLLIDLSYLRFQSPDGKYIACGAIDGIINVFDTASGKLMHTLEGHAMPVRSVSLVSQLFPRLSRQLFVATSPN